MPQRPKAEFLQGVLKKDHTKGLYSE